MKFLNKSAIIESIVKKTGLNKKDSKSALEAFVSTVQENLSHKHGVRLSGLGAFKVNHHKARKGRNPQNGKPLKIAARNVPAFKAASALKRSVNK